jgi:transposase
VFVDSPVGVILVMMGQQCRSESLFYYFRLDDHVPQSHLLRLIDRYVSFDFVREKLKPFYSDTGSPSIDPERLLRILLIGYLYGVTSERRLVEELRMHLAWRWFTGLSFDQEVPHHSTFSKNRHGRFQQSKIFEELFEQIVRPCVDCALVKGDHLSVDGSFIQAAASNSSRIPREQFSEAAQVKRNVREYLEDLERENPIPAKPHQQDKVSTTDPDAVYFSKGDRAPVLGYFDNYLIDNASCGAIGVEGTDARPSQELEAARTMVATCTTKFGVHPKTLTADGAYGKGEFFTWLEAQGRDSYIPLRKSYPSNDRLYGIDHFVYYPETNTYECPEGKELKYIGIKPAVDRSYIYRSTPIKYCGWPRKPECTTGRYKQLVIHVNEAARQRAQLRNLQPAFFHHQCERRKIEAVFGELKNQLGLRHLHLRRPKYVREQFLIGATAQNLKRLVRYLSTKGPSESDAPDTRIQPTRMPVRDRQVVLLDMIRKPTSREFFNSYKRSWTHTVLSRTESTSSRRPDNHASSERLCALPKVLHDCKTPAYLGHHNFHIRIDKSLVHDGVPANRVP